MFDDNERNSLIMEINQEQIKGITRDIRKYSADLDLVRKRADEIWKSCEMYLDDSVINSIQTVKDINRKRYNRAFEELEGYANRIESVANIWKETEDEIKASSIKLENIFSDIGRTFTDMVNNKNN